MANIQIIQGDFEKKLHDLLERLWGREVPKTVGPDFITFLRHYMAQNENQ